jgi:hypothetical protein
MSLLPKFRQPTEDRQAKAYNEVLRYEAKLGGQLFGPIPQGHRREFFCLDKHTWVWHEEWTDADGQRQIVTTHYQVRPDGILKSQNGGGYRRLTHAELHNLYQAAKLYAEVVPAALQRLLEHK